MEINDNKNMQTNTSLVTIFSLVNSMYLILIINQDGWYDSVPPYFILEKWNNSLSNNINNFCNYIL